MDETYDGYDAETLVSQLAGVQSTGAVNMHSIRGVQDVARQCEFDELAEYLNQPRPSGYIELLEEMGSRI